jgi:hypothetical protein
MIVLRGYLVTAGGLVLFRIFQLATVGVINAAIESARRWDALRWAMLLHRQRRISHSGLRTILSGTRLLERLEAFLALGHRQKHPQVE